MDLFYEVGTIKCLGGWTQEEGVMEKEAEGTTGFYCEVDYWVDGKVTNSSDEDGLWERDDFPSFWTF